MPKYDFFTSCPSCENKTKYYWSHSGCSGDMKIWHDGDLQCDSCSKCGFILDWKFDCGEHGKNEYLGPNPQILIKALASLSEVKMTMSTVFHILQKIRDKSGI